MRWRKKDKPEASPFKLLPWTALAGLVLTLVFLSEPFEDFLRTWRNNLHRHSVSGDIVLVKIDNQSLAEVGRWPWPRRHHAQMTDRLTAAGAKRIYFDVTFETRSNPVDDRLLAQSIERSGRVVLPVRGHSGPTGLVQQNPTPIAAFSRNAQLGSIAAQYNYQNAIWRLPYGAETGAGLIPSFAASLAGREANVGAFRVDYSFDPTTIPSISADKVINGEFDPAMFRGKDVLIGADAEVIGDQYFVPGVGKMGGVYVQILGAETLKAGNPRDLGWLPALVFSVIIAACAFSRKRLAVQNLVFASGVLTLLIAPFFLEANLVFVDIMPGLPGLATAWAVVVWRNMGKLALVNELSGLPNLNALRLNREGRNRALIAARVLNYEEIVATLPANGEQQLVEQIVSRLSVGATERTLYQGDAGIFAWFEDARAPFGNHLDALYSLFRNPAKVAGLPIDLTIAFGVEIGSGRSLVNRLASALVAAEEAAHDGLKWKYHDPDSLEDASWKLSILSELDAAIDRGEVWVAYQPKLDIATRRIIGAEALARWTHPEKGPIAASEFVAAAEQNDRIGKLTDYILEKSIAGAAAINKRGPSFGIAVNLSARLLSDKGFTLRVAALLARHGLDPQHLTLELTETAAVADSGESLEMITRLRELGVRISIDDYGTGLSTLDYLKKIPANEIKIDQSFVKGMADNRSDRLMVQSTISLAHSLDRKVVAEGVEQHDILELLTEMECDVAQGFAVGRPMSLDSLSKRIAIENKRAVA